MGNLVEAVSAVEDKIKRLLNRQVLCENENRDLNAQLEEKEAEISDLRDKIDSLKSDNQSFKAANAMLGSNEYKRETKLKINSLIREIDQCIVQLSE